MTMSATAALGPSPHARGNRARVVVPDLPPGSIPARTGNPDLPTDTSSHPPVHSRTHGEPCAARHGGAGQEGPSPHARGTRTSRRIPWRRYRSIPARTGDPLCHRVPADLPVCASSQQKAGQARKPCRVESRYTKKTANSSQSTLSASSGRCCICYYLSLARVNGNFFVPIIAPLAVVQHQDRDRDHQRWSHKIPDLGGYRFSHFFARVACAS